MNAADLTLLHNFRSGYWKEEKGIPQTKMYYNANELLEYICLGPWGASLTDPAWIVEKIAYTVTSQIDTLTHTRGYVAANNPSALTYG